MLTNPCTELPVEPPANHTRADIDAFLKQSQSAFKQWRATPIEDRAAHLTKLAEQLRKNQNALAQLMVEEMGKPITPALQEIEKCAVCCDWFAQNGPRLLASKLVASDAGKSYVRFDPIGAVLAIMPWNFPYWQVIRFAAPTLLAGNVGLLKHAPNVPQCSLAIQKLCEDAGFPRGVFRSLLIDHDLVPTLLDHPHVAAVTLTGSDRAGSAVASAAGQRLKKSVMELGGSDPFIVLADAVPSVAKAAAGARCINTGQSCIAAKRFIIEAPIYDAFVEAMTKEMLALKIGDPQDKETQIGPLARIDLLENLHRQVERTVASGARLLAGGTRLDRKGFFYAPTVLADVKPGMAAFDEETFGPVAALIKADNSDHAIALANQSQYALGSSIWTNNLSQAEQLAAQLDSGNVFINGIVKSDPRLPFGGQKRSGFGRELADFGIHEFVNIKTVWIK